MKTRRVAWLLIAGLAVAGPASAQLVGGRVGGVLPGGEPLGAVVDTVSGVAAPATRLTDQALRPVVETVDSYRRQAAALLRRNPRVLEADEAGRPVVRGEVAALDMTPEAVERAKAAGFSVTRQETVEGLDLAVLVLAPPRGMSAREAVARLRALDPQGRYDLNHIYFESGATAAPGLLAAAGAIASGEGLRIGLVDGSASASQPALARAPMTQRPFAPGGARVTAHGTAVASLLAGSGGGFRGAAPGASLYVADVYGPTPAGGSALAVARGLGWLAQERTAVINISLVGPPNAVLERAVSALVAKGHLVVAAVGNDGPSAEPLYPAAYPGVVAVTGVDGRRRVLPEAGRGRHVAFAAPGADMAAADLKGGFGPVRGASFAAPLAAGRLARLLPAPDPTGARRALEALGREAVDLGAPGPDPIYGRGLVAAELAVRPASLSARR